MAFHTAITAKGKKIGTLRFTILNSNNKSNKYSQTPPKQHLTSFNLKETVFYKYKVPAITDSCREIQFLATQMIYKKCVEIHISTHNYQLHFPLRDIRILAYSAAASSAGASVATGAAAFLERRVRVFLATGLAIFSLKSTNSMKHISAASPRRVPSLIIRV